MVQLRQLFVDFCARAGGIGPVEPRLTPARAPSLRARVSAGSAIGTSASAPSSPAAARSRRFIASHLRSLLRRRRPRPRRRTRAGGGASACRRSRPRRRRTRTRPARPRAAREKRPGTASRQVRPGAPADRSLDRVGDLVGFLERVRRDGTEILLQIPGATAPGIAEPGHDFQQAVNRHECGIRRALP